MLKAEEVAHIVALKGKSYRLRERGPHRRTGGRDPDRRPAADDVNHGRGNHTTPRTIRFLIAVHFSIPVDSVASMGVVSSLRTITSSTIGGAGGGGGLAR
jgi:hypothetical protein